MAELEKAAAKLVKLERLKDCICKPKNGVLSFYSSPEEFEADGSRICPVHGFRRLGEFRINVFVNPDQTYAEESIKLQELVDAYLLRLSQIAPCDIDLEDDSQAA